VDDLNGQEAWFSSIFLNGSVDGAFYTDIAGFAGIHVSHLDDVLNMSMTTVDAWDLHLPNGKKRNATVGNLGFGPASLFTNDADVLAPGLLDQLKKRGDIGTSSFGLHIGSVPLDQRASMILGGYAQNRALGDVGVFNFEGDVPRCLLVDVVLGVETGRSPLNTTGSIWKGLGGSERGAETTELMGGRLGSAAVIPNAASPYIYLPLGNCEAIAETLPVAYDEGLNLYLWQTDDPEFERIVNSPAYIGFTFADDDAANITIKVPFKLLNLTLEEPLVDKPTQYFPCQPTDSEMGIWQLGRAFLQAAFLGVNFETDHMYLAQAPGPDMAQLVTREMGEDDKTIRTNDGDTFAETWRSTWTPIEDKEETDATSTGEKGGSSGEATEEEDGLATGEIAGIVVGSAAGVASLVAIAWFFWRRNRSKNNKLAMQDHLNGEKGFDVPADDATYEMYAPVKTHEAPGRELAHELPSPKVMHEMDGTGIAMKADRGWQ
jgi:hypothetical protein